MSNPAMLPAERDARMERDILALLMNRGSAGLWSVEEIELELEDKLAVTDALMRLQRSGLVHRYGELVLITRAARRTLTLVGF